MRKLGQLLLAAAIVATPATIIGLSDAAQAAAPLNHTQVPGYYRAKVGDFEITSLYDGGGVFDPQWLHAEPATMQHIVEEKQRDTHMLDSNVSGFLVNTGKKLILVDAGTGGWWGGPTFGHLVSNLRSAGYRPEQVDLVLITHLHADHVGGITSHEGKRVFPNAEIYVAASDGDFWLSPEITAKAPKEAQEFFHIAQAVAAPYIKAGKWHTFSGSIDIADGVKSKPLSGHTPGHTGYEFVSQGQRLLFWGDIMHAQRVQLKLPAISVVFDIDEGQAKTTRRELLPTLSGQDILIGGAHMAFPCLGRLQKDGDGYAWESVSYSPDWVTR